MGLRPTRGGEKRLGSVHNFNATTTLSFVIPSVAERSAVRRTYLEKQNSYPQTNLSSRPERTRISCHAALDTATCAAFSKEAA
jgi:hypothetical protein